MSEIACAIILCTYLDEVSGHKLVDVVVVQKITKAMADRDGGKVSLGPPKTKNSRRTVGLTDGAVETLREHLTRQLAEMERWVPYRPGGSCSPTRSAASSTPPTSAIAP